MPEKLRCTYCGRQFGSEQALLWHVGFRHPQELNQINRNGDELIRPEVDLQVGSEVNNFSSESMITDSDNSSGFETLQYNETVVPERVEPYRRLFPIRMMSSGNEPECLLSNEFNCSTCIVFETAECPFMMAHSLHDHIRTRRRFSDKIAYPWFDRRGAIHEAATRIVSKYGDMFSPSELEILITDQFPFLNASAYEIGRWFSSQLQMDMIPPSPQQEYLESEPVDHHEREAIRPDHKDPMSTFADDGLSLLFHELEMLPKLSKELQIDCGWQIRSFQFLEKALSQWEVEDPSNNPLSEIFSQIDHHVKTHNEQGRCCIAYSV